MNQKIQAPQGARPKTAPILAWTFIVVGILATGMMLAVSHFRKNVQVQPNPNTVVATVKPVPAEVAAPAVLPAQTITASAPVDNMAPETRAALERAGLHDVQFSSLAFTVKPRKPIIVGSAVPKVNQVTR